MLVFIMAILRCSFAQRAGYQLFTVGDGLVQSEVTALHQDKKGFLWIGTKNGISRFDGHTFHTIRDSAGVSEAWVKYICDLNDSTVWFFTTRGCLVYTYEKTTVSIRSYPLNDGSTGYWTKDGAGFFVTDALELYQVDYQGLKHVKTNLFDGIKAVMPENGWVDLTYSKIDGNFYFRSKQGALGCLRNNRITYIYQGSYGKLWTGTDNRIYFFTPQMALLNLMMKIPAQTRETTKLYCISDTLVTPVADFGRNTDLLENSLLIRNKDTLYLASPNKSLIQTFIHGKVAAYRYPFAYINAMLIDNEHNLWLGLATGLARLHSFSFTNFNEADGLHKNLQFVAEDKHQKIIVGGYDKGVQKVEDGAVTNIPMPAFQGKSVAWQIYPGCMKDRSGDLQISITPYCIINWDGKRIRHDPALPIMASFSFYEDTLRQLCYSGTDQGLLVHKASPSGYTLLKKFPGDNTNRAVSLVMDNAGRLLMGGFKGLSFMEGENFTALPTREFPYSEGANAMVKDHRGNIWIGNSRGLWLFDMKRFRKIPNVWFNDLVVSLCRIDSTKLFIGGLHGIGFLDLDTFYKTDSAIIRYFNADNGFTGNECQQNAVCYDSRGILWVATTDNLQRIDPGNLPSPLAGPKVYIVKISLLDETMQPEPLVITAVAAGTLHLTHDETNLRFDYTTPVFRGSSFVRFRYRLEGQDANWSQPTTERYAVYTNLAPGKYNFRVIACNDAGNWSASPASFTIIIRPALWQTWWVITLFVILMAGFFFWMGTLVMGHRKRLMQEKLESEKKIAELQLIAIRNQIDPHFTFNAMNSIASVILKEEKEKAYSFFVKLSTLIRQVLTSGDKVTRTLAEELVFVQNYLDIEKLRFRDSFQFNLDIIEPVNLEQEVPKMVIQTYAENALKHGLLNKKEGVGKLVITIGEHNSQLHIEIEDNGIGREKARQLKQSSTGRGMMILNFYYDFFDRYNEHKIIHEVTDLFTEHNKPAGTKVTVIIPTGFNYKITANDAN